MKFLLLEVPKEVETMASGTGIRELNRLRKAFGGHRWKNRKGIARVELSTGRVRLAEVHWYECHGVGRRMIKVKKLLD